MQCTVSTFLKSAIVNLGTLPYYRFFRQNTLLPILHIVRCVQRGDSNVELVNLLMYWRERKLYELHYIQVAVSVSNFPSTTKTLMYSKSTILAGAVIGCFSWVPATDGYWIGPALWYFTLVLAIVAILLSSSQAFIFSALNTPSLAHNSPGDFRRYLALILAIPPEDFLSWDDSRPTALDDCLPRWKMVFTWQAPMMLMAYAVACFMAGLMVYVCTPLLNGEVDTPGAKVRVRLDFKNASNRLHRFLFSF